MVSSSFFHRPDGDHSETHQHGSVENGWDVLFSKVISTNSVDSPFLDVSAPSDRDLYRVTDRALENLVDRYYSNGNLKELFSKLHDRDMVVRVAGRILEVIFSQGTQTDPSLSHGIAAIYLVDDIINTVNNPRQRDNYLKSQKCILLQKSGDFPGDDLELAMIFAPNEDRPGFHSYTEINPLFLSSNEEAIREFNFNSKEIEILKDNEFIVLPITTKLQRDVQIGTIVAVRPRVFAEDRLSDFSFVDSLERLGQNLASALLKAAKREASLSDKRVG